MSNDRSSEEKRFLKALGKALISISARQKKSLERVAYEAGVSKGYIYDIANGEANPSLVVIHRISSTLDISVWELLKNID